MPPLQTGGVTDPAVAYVVEASDVDSIVFVVEIKPLPISRLHANTPTSKCDSDSVKWLI